MMHRRGTALVLTLGSLAVAVLANCGDDEEAVPIGGVDASFDATTDAPGKDTSTPPTTDSGGDAGKDVTVTDVVVPEDASDAGDASDAPACAVGELMCDGGCTPTTTNNEHCGSCSNVCSGGATCFDAGCVSLITGDAGTTCDTTARAAFPTILTPNGVYLVEGIPVNTPAPLTTTTFIRVADGGLDLGTCNDNSGVTTPVAEYSMGLARAANSVYLVGGNTSVQTQTAVYRSNIADGGLGSFATAAQPDGGAVALQTSRYGHGMLQTGDFVYVIGGWNGVVGVSSNTLDTIERATIDVTSGDFTSTFAPVAATLALPRFGGMVFHAGTHVYYIGGQTGVGTASVLHDEVQHATLDANGNLSTFTQVGTLPNALAGAGMITVGGTLYLVGGGTAYSNPNYTLTSAVLAAPIANDGSLGAFATTGLTLPYASAFGGTLVMGNTLYLFEGLTGTGFTASNKIQSLTLP